MFRTRGRLLLLQKNEEERDKAGEDEDKTQQEHTRLLQWSYTITSAYEALAKAANELVARDQVLVDSSKAVMIPDGLPEGFVKQLPGAWVPIDQKLEAQQDVLRLMESFRDVSLLFYRHHHAAGGVSALFWRLHSWTLTSC